MREVRTGFPEPQCWCAGTVAYLQKQHLENVRYRLGIQQPWAFSITNESKDFLEQNEALNFFLGLRNKDACANTQGGRKESGGLSMNTEMVYREACFQFYVLHFYSSTLFP